jgi:ankyrin repeat protein
VRSVRRLLLILAVLGTTACGAAQPDEEALPGPQEPPATTALEAGAGETTKEAPRKETTANKKELAERMISAAGRGDPEAVERFLEEGATVDARDRDGRTALVAAAYGNHLEAARLLVEAGEDVDAKDVTEQSAYLISTSEVGDDPRLLELTLDNGVDVESLDSYNGTGLIRAAERGHARIVERLLETDVAVDHVNNLGWTTLLEAIILGDGGRSHTEVVRLLVREGGADPNLADDEGVTPLEHARERGYAGIEGILLEAVAR